MPYLRHIIKRASRDYPHRWERWVDKQVVPRAVLLTIWESGIKFCDNPPDQAMRIEALVDLLWKHVQFLNSCIGQDVALCKERDATLFLYTDTVQSELMPDWSWKVRQKKKKLGSLITAQQ